MIKVSISCLAFNHEAFIQKTLEGFMMQKTNFEFEVLIHDDASTDRTVEIINDFVRQYPDVIKPIFQSENQWRKGIRGGAVHNFPRAKGKYIALCEGDDYWTDPTKLQRQVDFLDANPDYALVAENGLVINTVKNTEYQFNNMPECDISVEQLLGKRKFPTASVMFRHAYLDEGFYALKYKPDVIVWSYLASKGKIKYFPTVSSVYSRGVHGIVLSSRNLEWAMMLEEWNEVLADILPPGVDKSLLKKRNFNEYLKVFYQSAKKKDARVSIAALKKCFKYQPLTTIKAVVKVMFIQKTTANIN
jgi:glycosyltransferase involved in cell wall biosynthesis